MTSKPILYIKPGCPWCRAALDFFAAQGLALDVRDVIASQPDREHMLKISGQTRTPTFEYGSFVVADFSVDEFLAKLAQAPAIQCELGLTAGKQ
jgi:monothiol glutaredoxin